MTVWQIGWLHIRSMMKKWSGFIISLRSALGWLQSIVISFDGPRLSHFKRWMSGYRWQGLVVAVLLVLGLTLGSATAEATNFDRKNLRQQDFSGQDLTDNDYTRADMTETNLSNVNLRGVRMFTTHLDKANLEGADLTGATLDGATLRKANLKDAVLEGAYVISADFTGANIEGTDFTDVLFEPRVNDMLCETASGTNPTTGRETRETLFCP